MSQKIHQARQYLNSHALLGKFMPYQQRYALLASLIGEEGEAIADIILKAVEQIMATPLTRETDGQGGDAIAHLHYFRGSVDAWITERDIGDTPDGDGLGVQRQAFGKITLTGDPADAEYGYISIHELIANNVELDLHWEPKRIGDL